MHNATTTTTRTSLWWILDPGAYPLTFGGAPPRRGSKDPRRHRHYCCRVPFHSIDHRISHPEHPTEQPGPCRPITSTYSTTTRTARAVDRFRTFCASRIRTEDLRRTYCGNGLTPSARSDFVSNERSKSWQHTPRAPLQQQLTRRTIRVPKPHTEPSPGRCSTSQRLCHRLGRSGRGGAGGASQPAPQTLSRELESDAPRLVDCPLPPTQVVQDRLVVGDQPALPAVRHQPTSSLPCATTASTTAANPVIRHRIVPGPNAETGRPRFVVRSGHETSQVDGLHEAGHPLEDSGDTKETAKSSALEDSSNSIEASVTPDASGADETSVEGPFCCYAVSFDDEVAAAPMSKKTRA